MHITGVVEQMAPKRNLSLWWFGTLICWHQMKQTQWGKKEDKSDRGSDWGEKKGYAWERVEMCVCAGVVCEALRSAMKSWAEMANLRSVKNVWMHLRASRDKKGSSGVQGLLLGLLIPRPSHPFRACLRSGSPRGRPSSASRFNMLCVPAPPAPLHLNHYCPRAGPPLPASRSLLKAPFKPGDVFG